MHAASDLAPLLPALLDALANASSAVTVLGDRGQDIERWYVNEPAAALIGYAPHELEDVPVIDTVIPEHRALLEQLRASFRAGQPVPPAVEITLLHRDGSHVPIEVAIGHVKLPGGDAYVCVIRDVGTRQQAQLPLLEADRIALVGALAAGFAHETNNPLTSVLLNLRSMRKQLHAHLPEAAQVAALRCLDDITTGAERIASNVRALQTLATRSATQPIDLAALVSAALRLATPTLEPRAHVIRSIFPVRPVAGEESRIGQAVLAMMLFSCSGFDPELSTSGNRIVVVVEERDDAVVVEVSDNGRALTIEETRRAFDPFFRSSARGAGVGVGLGVARSVATALGGEVRLAARPGGGAVITMRLPRAPDQKR
jgi:PAS domain S-box-containing protein